MLFAHELHLSRGGDGRGGGASVQSHLIVLQGGGDFSSCEPHPGCRLDLPVEGLPFLMRSFLQILTQGSRWGPEHQ